MIIQEHIGNFIRTYSDSGVYIHGGFPEADYAESIDPENIPRSYVETNRKIELGDQPDNLDNSIQYLVRSRLIYPTNTEDEPDYFNENESEPNYFN